MKKGNQMLITEMDETISWVAVKKLHFTYIRLSIFIVDTFFMVALVTRGYMTV